MILHGTEEYVSQPSGPEKREKNCAAKKELIVPQKDSHGEKLIFVNF